jgi:hypothetical protein
MKATTDNYHKIMAVISRSVDPIVREIGDLRSKQALMQEFKSNIDYLLRQLEKTATRDNLDSFMSHVDQTYTNRRDTQSLADIIEQKADHSELLKMKNRSYEIDRLVIDVEKQINSESQVVKNCKDAIAAQ